jgi:hypothetical protein
MSNFHIKQVLCTIFSGQKSILDNFVFEIISYYYICGLISEL